MMVVLVIGGVEVTMVVAICGNDCGGGSGADNDHGGDGSSRVRMLVVVTLFLKLKIKNACVQG